MKYPRPGPILVALVLVLPGGCGDASAPGISPVAARDQPPPQVERLLRLMRARLAIMHDVARTKLASGRPVADPARERQLLSEMEEMGRKHELEPDITRAFFTAQIHAARSIQEGDLARWRAGAQVPPDPPPSLASLRERIDRLNRALLSALAEARPRLDSEARSQLPRWAAQVLAGEGITMEARGLAIEPLQH